MGRRNVSVLLIVTLVGVQFVPPADAGVKQFFKDTYNKVKSFFHCDSHETEDEHKQAAGNAATVNTIEGIGETADVTATTTFTTAPITTAASTFPPINIRINDADAEYDIGAEGRVLINPPPICPPGRKRDHTGICREIV